MSMPIFRPGDDPGANFSELVKRMGLVPPTPKSIESVSAPHATTCLAMRYVDGVLVAGDRRATQGNWISHRGMEKVFQTDKFSAVAISGVAGPAMDMTKLFALQLEHYEKIQGRALSLEGKANQLSVMLRNNLPAAMNGLRVEPLFAGFDEHDGRGRLWNYDVTGGRYEENEYTAIGSGMMHAGTVVKVGWKSDLSSQEATELACRALWEASDVDSATGGPDALRGVYPVVALINSSGWQQIGDNELAVVFAKIIEEMRTR